MIYFLRTYHKRTNDLLLEVVVPRQAVFSSQFWTLFSHLKDMHGEEKDAEIASAYGVKEAPEAIVRSVDDYNIKFDNSGKLIQ